MLKKTALAVAAICLAGISGPAHSEEWRPKQNIEIVVHSGTDTSIYHFSKDFADWLMKKEPIRVSVVSITGARGDRARRNVQVENKGNPYVMQAMTPSVVGNAVQMKSDVLGSGFTPYAILVVSPSLIAVNAKSPYKTLDDLVKAAREKPGAILHGGGDYGSVGSFHHRLMERELGIKMSYVPNDETSKSIVALLGGHVQFTMQNPEELMPYVNSGDLRILASTDPLPDLPDVKTFKELGLNFRVFEQYRGMWGPPGIPPEATEYYRKVLREYYDSDAFKEFAKKFNIIRKWKGGDEMGAFIREEEESYKTLFVEMGLMK